MSANYESDCEEFQDLFRQSGWTQAEAARQLMVTPNHISMIVREESNPSKPLLELFRLKMARKFGRDPDDEIAQLFRQIQHLEPEKKRTMTKIVEILLQDYSRAKDPLGV